jgi:hypothetical protein
LATVDSVWGASHAGLATAFAAFRAHTTSAQATTSDARAVATVGQT